MKKQIVLALAVATVLVVTLAAIAQQDQAGRQRFQQRREAQIKAVDAIAQDAAKLKAAMEEATKAMQGRQNFQDMSEEERTKMREEFTKRREEQTRILADIEQQLLVLKSPRQLKADMEEATGELSAIRDLAKEEKADKTAQRIQALIDKQQAKYDQLMQKLGYTQQ
jgi:hypothetical protein